MASAESRHLRLGRLAADGDPGCPGSTLERLPGLADDFGVGGDGPFGRHAKRVRLKADVGREFPLALRAGAEPDGTGSAHDLFKIVR